MVLGRGQRGRAAALVTAEGNAFGAGGAFGAANIVDQRGQAVEFARSAEEINLREALEHVGAVAFGHAAKHADNDLIARLLADTHQAQSRICLVFSLFAH